MEEDEIQLYLKSVPLAYSAVGLATSFGKGFPLILPALPPLMNLERLVPTRL